MNQITVPQHFSLGSKMERQLFVFFLERAKMEIAFEIFPPLTRTEECWKIKFNKKKERIKKNQKENKPKKH